MLDLEHFQDDSNICIFETLEEYIFRAKPSCEKSDHTQLFLSHIEPHFPVKAFTLSWQICQVLKYAGINNVYITLC